jgi:peptidoglycan/xylan/chitin deacetylase (PgdA/CDA1 family)
MALKRIRWVFIALGILALILCALFFLSKSRSFQLFGKLVTRVDTEKKRLALTIDDGPSERTAGILQALKELDVPATFFLCGSAIEQRPEDAQAIAKAGHAIGNHSYSHQRMVLVSYGFCKSEIERTNLLIRQAGYTGTIYFRPPNFKRLFTLPLYLKNAGITTVLADVEPETALGSAAAPQTIADYMVDHARPGSILLAHAMYNDNSLEAIRLAVPRLKAAGYEFVTIDQLIEGA